MAKAVAVAGSGSENAEQKNAWQRFQDFLRDVRNEMRKVTQPSRKEVQATTVVVIITVFLFGVYFWIVDTVLGQLIDHLIRWAKTF